jgi:hypothetical protein
VSPSSTDAAATVPPPSDPPAAPETSADTAAAPTATEPGTHDAPQALVLRSDGLEAGAFDAVARFGDPEPDVMPIMNTALGTPSSTDTYPYADARVQRRTFTWDSVGGASFRVLFEDADGVFRLRGWELDGLRGLDGLSVATSDGIGLGTTVEELLSADPDTVFGGWPEPGCGDVWWSPGVFSAGDGLRGEVGSPPDDRGHFMLLDQALVQNGFPDGLECQDDVMCYSLFEEVRMALGLQPGFGLDRELWLALGLPLPFDQTAPVVMLRAGTLVTTC